MCLLVQLGHSKGKVWEPVKRKNAKRNLGWLSLRPTQGEKPKWSKLLPVGLNLPTQKTYFINNVEPPKSFFLPAAVLFFLSSICHNLFKIESQNLHG